MRNDSMNKAGSFRHSEVTSRISRCYLTELILLLHKSALRSHNRAMTEKEIVLETIRALPDDCSIEEIAERVKFMAAVQKGIDQLDRGEGIPHDEVKRQLASWLTN